MDYPALAEDATDMLAEFGQDITLRKVTIGTYDPATGTSTNTEADTTRKGVVFDFTLGETMAAGTLIQSGDRRVYLDSNGVAPTLTDKLVIQGVVWGIRNVKTLDPGGVATLHELQIRR